MTSNKLFLISFLILICITSCDSNDVLLIKIDINNNEDILRKISAEQKDIIIENMTPYPDGIRFTKNNKITETLTIKIPYIKFVDGLKKLKRINSLSIEDCELEKIPLMDASKTLTSISIANNHIKKIENLTQFPNLKILNISSCKIEKIEGLNNLRNLEVLIFEHNYIKKIQNLDNQKKLKILNLFENRINSIENINSEYLETLIISRMAEGGYNEKDKNKKNGYINKITGLDKLINLKNLNLSNNAITHLKNISKLVNVETINLK